MWVQCSVTREQLDLLELETHKCIIREIYYSAHSEARQINQAGRADPRARDQIRTVNKYRAGPRHVSGVRQCAEWRAHTFSQTNAAAAARICEDGSLYKVFAFN